jgi:hypothetical protein
MRDQDERETPPKKEPKPEEKASRQKSKQHPDTSTEENPCICRGTD